MCRKRRACMDKREWRMMSMDEKTYLDYWLMSTRNGGRRRESVAGMMYATGPPVKAVRPCCWHRPLRSLATLNHRPLSDPSAVKGYELYVCELVGITVRIYFRWLPCSFGGDISLYVSMGNFYTGIFYYFQCL